MAVGVIEVRRKFVSEVCHQALRRIDEHEDASVVEVMSVLRLPVQDNITLEPTYEWKMGVAGTTTTTTTVAASDRRLKRDIERIGQTAGGLALYRFRYLWSDEVFVGVMAQDVLLVQPQAVIVCENGYMQVDYAMLGIQMLRWEQWRRFGQTQVYPEWVLAAASAATLAA